MEKMVLPIDSMEHTHGSINLVHDSIDPSLSATRGLCRWCAHLRNDLSVVVRSIVVARFLVSHNDFIVFLRAGSSTIGHGSAVSRGAFFESNTDLAILCLWESQVRIGMCWWEHVSVSVSSPSCPKILMLGFRLELEKYPRFDSKSDNLFCSNNTYIIWPWN